MQQIGSRRLAGLVSLALALGLLGAGCFRNEVVIKVKPDGSGNIVVTRVFSKEMIRTFQAQMDKIKEMSASNPGMQMNMPDDPFYDEKTLKKAAGQFGAGVTFVKAQRIDKPDGSRGSAALYSFKDIGTVFVDLKTVAGPEAGAGMMMGGRGDDDGEIPVAEKTDESIQFQLTKGPEAQLKVVVPDYPPSEPVAAPVPGQAPGDTGAETHNMFGPNGPDPEMLASMGGQLPFGLTGQESGKEAMRKMLAGMLVSVSVEVDGKTVKANASYPSKSKPNRYTLMEMDMDKLMATPKFNQTDPEEMGMRGGSSPLDFFGTWSKTAGMTVETNRNVVIKFK